MERKAYTRLDEHDVLAIKRQLDMGIEQQRIAQTLNISRATISRVKRALQGNAEYNTLAELVKRARKMADSPAPATLPAAPKAPSKQATDQKEDTQGLLQKLDQTQMHLNNLAAIVDSYADKIIELDDLLNETVKKMTLLKGSF